VELTGGGVDLVADPVGGDRFVDSLRALRPTGRLLVLGFTGGAIPEVKVNRLLLRNIAVVGAGFGAWMAGHPDDRRTVGDEVHRLAEQGVVRPLVGPRFALEDGADAMRLLEGRGATGKVVLTVDS
jgi:NADPH:quinone reductase